MKISYNKIDYPEYIFCSSKTDNLQDIQNYKKSKLRKHLIYSTDLYIKLTKYLLYEK